MKFAKWVFLIAGVYGLLVLLPQYFLETRQGLDYPPPINHPEYYYGFIGVAVAWQVLFLLLATNPARYRLMLLPAILEKASFGIAAPVLFLQGRVPAVILVFAIIDLILGALFALAYVKTASPTPTPDD